MKTIIKTTLLIATLSISVVGCSHKTRQVTQNIKETADTVGQKAAELASKGAAQVTDKIYEGKVGPAGQTIYIDKNSNYFYVNEKGKRIFLKESELMDKK